MRDKFATLALAVCLIGGCGTAQQSQSSYPATGGYRAASEAPLQAVPAQAMPQARPITTTVIMAQPQIVAQPVYTLPPTATSIPSYSPTPKHCGDGRYGYASSNYAGQYPVIPGRGYHYDYDYSNTHTGTSSVQYGTNSITWSNSHIWEGGTRGYSYETFGPGAFVGGYGGY